MILKMFLTISSINYFSIEQKFCKHFLQTRKLQIANMIQLFTISFTLAPEKYFVKLCNTCTVRKFDLSCGIEMYHFEGLL